MGLPCAVEWRGGYECVGLGLNDLIDKIHVYFLNRAPAFSKTPPLWSWKRIGPPFHGSNSFSFPCYTQRGQQMVTLDVQIAKNEE